MRELLRPFAESYRGELRSLSGATVLFLHRAGFDATFELLPGGPTFQAKPSGRYYGHLTVSPEGIGTATAKWFGRRDIEIGDSEFDGLYEVNGRPEEFVREVLTRERRALIRALGRKGEVRFTVRPSGLRLRLSGLHSITQKELRTVLDQILFTGLQLAESLATSGTAGIVLVDSRGEGLVTACQVCGSPFEGEMVECAKCATLHHRECWDYLGQCSTFACGSLASRKSAAR